MSFATASYFDVSVFLRVLTLKFICYSHSIPDWKSDEFLPFDTQRAIRIQFNHLLDPNRSLFRKHRTPIIEFFKKTV